MKSIALLISALLIASCGFSDKSKTADVDDTEKTKLNQSPISIMTIRDVTCGDWISEIEVNEAERDSNWLMKTNEAWLLGYMSGLAIGNNADALKNTDATSMILYVTNYCKQNPLNRISEVGDKLFLELIWKNNTK